MSSHNEELNQQIQNKFIRDTVKPFQSKSKISMEESGIPVYKVESNENSIEDEFVKTPPHNFTPITQPMNNYVDFYSSVRTMCKHLYGRNDGIYFAIIIILCIFIIILLKIVYQKK
jgi:hypothetical protein